MLKCAKLVEYVMGILWVCYGYPMARSGVWQVVVGTKARKGGDAYGYYKKNRPNGAIFLIWVEVIILKFRLRYTSYRIMSSPK